MQHYEIEKVVYSLSTLFLCHHWHFGLITHKSLLKHVILYILWDAAFA